MRILVIERVKALLLDRGRKPSNSNCHLRNVIRRMDAHCVFTSVH